MAQDKVNLFNLALATIGVRGKKISDPDEMSIEAEECRLWFEPARDHVLRAAYWPSAKAFRRLGVGETRDTSADWVATDPEPGWLYAYTAPTDMLRPRYLSTYERFSTGNRQDSGGNDIPAIFSSAEKAILIYTKRQDNIALWDAQLYLAIAHALGFFIAKPLTGKRSWANDAQEAANALLLQAQAIAANEPEDQLDVLPEWIQARGYEGPPRSNIFTFPFGPLLGGSSGGVSVR